MLIFITRHRQSNLERVELANATPILFTRVTSYLPNEVSTSRPQMKRRRLPHTRADAAPRPTPLESLIRCASPGEPHVEKSLTRRSTKHLEAAHPLSWPSLCPLNPRGPLHELELDCTAAAFALRRDVPKPPRKLSRLPPPSLVIGFTQSSCAPNSFAFFRSSGIRSTVRRIAATHVSMISFVSCFLITLSTASMAPCSLDVFRLLSALSSSP
mmetsp:Transcript_48564/g.96828  ORF Transcript_48564/g.96828 Transcript_48564/m.96828 type:complete len:213 (+) Transcript_48564:179-817(+)